MSCKTAQRFCEDGMRQNNGLPVLRTLKNIAGLAIVPGERRPGENVTKYSFEDFTPGRVFPLGPKHVTVEEIIEFASEFDPQPMHLDEAAGRDSILGGLAASGWHTSSMVMRMMIDSYLLNSLSEGSPGIDLMEWKRPVLAGDTLSGRTTVLEARALRSRPGVGIVKLRHEAENQRGEIVSVSENSIMFRMAKAPETSA